MALFHSYVKLPEGTFLGSYGYIPLISHATTKQNPHEITIRIPLLPEGTMIESCEVSLVILTQGAPDVNSGYNPYRPMK